MTPRWAGLRQTVVLLAAGAGLVAAPVPAAFGATLGAASWAATVPAPGQRAVETPFFSWPAMEDVVAYRLHLGTDAMDLPLIAEILAPQTWYIYVPGLRPDTDYAWRVDGRAADGTVRAGPLWTFRTRGLQATDPWPRPGQPNVSPSPSLAWTAGLTAYEQDLYLGTDANALTEADTGWPEYRRTVNADTGRWTLAGLEPNTAYFWRVDTVEISGLVHPGAVWSFSTWPDFEVLDPNLRAWWRLDEGAGQTVLDASGFGHHCFLDFGLWEPGRLGASLSLNRGTPPAEGTAVFLPHGDEPFTLAAWIRPRKHPRDQVLLWWGEALPAHANGLFLRDGRVEHSFGADRFGAPLGAEPEEWIHVAVTHAGGGYRRIFLNGTPQVGDPNGAFVTPQVSLGMLRIGGFGGATRDAAFRGLLDDVRVWNRVLDGDAIKGLVFGAFDRAGYPQPADRSTVDVEQALPLNWSAPRGAREQDVYVGTTYEEVYAADAQARAYQGRIPGRSYAPPGALQLGATYYWRVDSLLPEGQRLRGDIWRFTVARYLTVDDFESYTDQTPDMIFLSWHDGLGYDDPALGFAGNGTGATAGHLDPPYAERTRVHGGRQALPLYYDNRETGLSQVDRRLDPPQDWTRRDVRALHLYLAGRSDNAVTPSDGLYLRIEDSQGGQVTVAEGGADAASLLTGSGWRRWSVPLSRATAAGVDLTHVTRLSLGVGDPLAPQPGGGTGILYVDDIRLSVD